MGANMADLRTDIAQAEAAMGRGKLGTGKAIKRLESRLFPGETVVRMSAGRLGSATGVVVLTDRRLIFTADSLGDSQFEDMPFTAITAVQTSSTWMSGLGTLAVQVAGTSREITQLRKAEVDTLADMLRARIGAQAQAAVLQQQPQGQQTPPPDVMQQLAQLGQLRDAGVLTLDEFEAKKAELLSRL
jgi:hypothetical protein